MSPPNDVQDRESDRETRIHQARGLPEGTVRTCPLVTTDGRAGTMACLATQLFSCVVTI